MAVGSGWRLAVGGPLAVLKGGPYALEGGGAPPPLQGAQRMPSRCLPIMCLSTGGWGVISEAQAPQGPKNAGLGVGVGGAVGNSRTHHPTGPKARQNYGNNFLPGQTLQKDPPPQGGRTSSRTQTPGYSAAWVYHVGACSFNELANASTCTATR